MADEQQTTETSETQTTETQTQEATAEQQQQTTAETTETKAPTWPEDWRQRVAGDDAKVLKRFERYASPEAGLKALIEAQDRISQGFKPEPFPEKGTDEQKSAWRKAHDVPDDAGGYIENIGEGIVIGEDDKPIFESFAAKLHAAGLPQAAMNVAAQWYGEWVEEQQNAIFEQESQERQAAEDALTQELGPAEYRASKQNVRDTLAKFLPKESLERVLDVVERDVATAKGLFQLSREINPVRTLPGSGNDPGKSIDARLAEINDIRSKDYNAFMKNEALRKEERELLDAKERMKARAAA